MKHYMIFFPDHSTLVVAASSKAEAMEAAKTFTGQTPVKRAAVILSASTSGQCPVLASAVLRQE